MTLYALEAGKYRPATASEVREEAKRFAPRRKGAPIEYASGFLELYEAWPRKDNKAQGQEAWFAAGCPTIADMGAGWARDLREMEQRKREGRGGYIPMLATYLRGRRWEDAVEAMPTGPSQRQSAPAPAGKDWLKNLPR